MRKPVIGFVLLCLASAMSAAEPGARHEGQGWAYPIFVALDRDSGKTVFQFVLYADGNVLIKRCLNGPILSTRLATAEFEAMMAKIAPAMSRLPDGEIGQLAATDSAEHSFFVWKQGRQPTSKHVTVVGPVAAVTTPVDFVSLHRSITQFDHRRLHNWLPKTIIVSLVGDYDPQKWPKNWPKPIQSDRKDVSSFELESSRLREVISFMSSNGDPVANRISYRIPLPHEKRWLSAAENRAAK